MLNMSMMFTGLILLSSSVLATEKIISANILDAVQLDEDASEGRACGSCGGGVTVTPPTDPKPSLDWLAVLGALPVVGLQIASLILLIILLGEYGFHYPFVVGLQIASLILLIILLVHLLGAKDEAPAAYSSYAETGYADSGYSKRSSPSSSWSLRDIQDSPAVAFLTQVVSEAIDKHYAINEL
ncbi:unnamed protein product [Meganyctiphanes norvegica]|uniref:Uncharacterized protein n=1 Tax=Meganyctiphanes norvegica TaxID=48144 RepID=A0AAV2SI26_MEGNR